MSDSDDEKGERVKRVLERIEQASRPSVFHERDMLRMRVDGLQRDLQAAEHRIAELERMLFEALAALGDGR